MSSYAKLKKEAVGILASEEGMGGFFACTPEEAQALAEAGVLRTLAPAEPGYPGKWFRLRNGYSFDYIRTLLGVPPGQNYTHKSQHQE